jgi:3-isopropylmalate/(R)-2-methylmalate dehydratase small subunit
MNPFNTHRGIIAGLNRSNIDTDQLIPKQFLKSIRRTGYEKGPFFDWRFLANGEPDPSFELNQPRFKGASILVVNNNFGCGSSREHAVWALVQYGFRAIIAPKKGSVPAFADIYRNNSIKNGLLNIELTEDEVSAILKVIDANPGLEATIDLPNQTIMLHASTPVSYRFDITPSVKDHLVRGLDDIGLTLQNEADISLFESSYKAQKSWA